MPCRIHADLHREIQLLRLEGSDFSPVQQGEFRSLVKGVLDRGGLSKVVIDTSGLDLVGSCCLASIIEAAMTCHKLGVPVVLVEDRAIVLDVFEVVSLRSILPIQSTLDETGFSPAA